MHERNHIVARTFYAKVKEVFPGVKHDFSRGGPREMECMDLEDKSHYSVRGSELIGKFVSADTWKTEVQVPRTQIAQALIGAGALPFTVCFLKSKGVERILRGRLLEHEDLLGRSMVYDFDVESGAPMRMVDHRTLLWLILNGVRYTLKEK